MVNKLPKQFITYFWDTKFIDINARDNAFFIIERLLEKGNFDTLKWLLQNYSEDNIKSVIERSPNISPAKKHLLPIVLAS